MKSITLNLPLDKKSIINLKAGQFVLLNGIVYTARDAAHEKFFKELHVGKKLSVELKNQTIYYVGPTPAKPGEIIGAAGPTSSYRMDDFVEPLLKYGLKGMIGKGARGQKAVQACKKYKAIYFVTFGGCGALLSACIKKCTPVAFSDLGCEAVFELLIENFPAFVGIDTNGVVMPGILADK